MNFSNRLLARLYRQLVIPSLLLILVGSCVTTEKITYLQDYQTVVDTFNIDIMTYRVQSNDNLYIKVITPDPRWASMFNAMPITSTAFSGEASINLISYSVQLDGTIEFPFLGSIKVANNTLEEVKAIIEAELTDYISDASATVKLVNNYVSILGEVRSPGLYPIYRDQLNIFQALSMAGDMEDFGDRYNVKIVRQTNDGIEIKNFDLTDRSIVHLEYFHIIPNDVIYVQPIKGRFFNMNQFPFALILSSITTTILILSYVNTN